MKRQAFDPATPGCPARGKQAVAGNLEAQPAQPPRGRRANWPTVACCALAVVAGAACLPAATINLPNGSFESPATAYADPTMDYWQKTPKPYWYDESGGFLWVQLTGLFLNTPPESATYIDNCDGAQAAFLFAVPQVGLFQDNLSTNVSNSVPGLTLDAKFEVGSSYSLTAGVIGGGGNMLEGVSLELSLYYRDAATNMVTVAATNLIFTHAGFASTTHFVDCQVQTPTVKAGDAWAGQPLGVLILSTIVDPLLAGGYWDLDNVRLASMREPVLSGPTRSGGQFQFTLESEPGLAFEMIATTNLALPAADWTVLGRVTNVTGSVFCLDTTTNANRRFYKMRQLP